MDVGLALPQFDFSVPGRSPLQWADVVQWAQAAERLGLDSVWLADHVFWSIEKYGGPPGTHSALDPLAALGGVARATERVRLGTLVLCAPLRPPKVAAKALQTLDTVADGRLRVGVGAGWYEPEFHAAGIPFERPAVRLRQLAEAVDAYKARLASVFVGGRGDRLLDVVARHADGWNTGWTMTPADYRPRLAVLDAACERAGRDPATVERSLCLYALVGESEADLRRRFERLQQRTPPGVLDGVGLEEWRTGRLVGTVEQVREQLAGWAELGVVTVVAGMGALPFAVSDVEDLEPLAAARQGLS